MADKKVGSWKIFVRFLKIMGKPLPLFLFAMIIHMVGDNLFNVTLSLFVKNMVDMAQTGNNERFVDVLLWTILAGVVFLMIFFVFGAIYDIEAKRGNAKVQKLVVEKALRMPMEYYDNHHSGEIVSKLLNDADVASQIFTSRLRRVTTPIMSVVVYFIPMVIMNYRLALCLLGVNIVSLIVNSRYLEPMKKSGKSISEKKKELTKSISTIVSGISNIKMYQGFRLLTKRFKSDSKEYSYTRKKAIKLSSMLVGINTFFDMICALVFLILAIYFVDNGMASLSSVAAIYTLYGSFSYNFLELGKYLPELMNCIARAQIVFAYLDSEEEKGIMESEFSVVEEETTKYESAVELINVKFGYEVSQRNNFIYDNTSITIPYGSSTAVVGKSGCGKSTMFKLLLGFYKPKCGEIKVLGKTQTDETLFGIRNQFAYVPQNPYLFGISVMENIRLGNISATDEQVIEAAKNANAHNFIMNLPNGYNTVLESGGNNLSGGERQRIAIARAFVRNASILLMDEATASLDNENDILIQDAVKRIVKNSTALVIAHRPDTIAACDNVIKI